MKATKINHRGEVRIKVDIPYNQSIIALLRQIFDARWSKTLRAWHIPYTKEAFNQLKTLFPDVEYPQKKTDIQEVPEIKPAPVSPVFNYKKDIVVEVIGRQIFLKMPPNDTDIQFMRSFRYSRWDKNSYSWVMSNYPGNLDLLKDYFKDRLTRIVVHPTSDVSISTFQKRNIANNEVLMIKAPTGRLKVIFGYHKLLTQALSKFPYSRWDVNNKWWSIPYTPAYAERVKQLVEAQQLELVYEEETVDNQKVSRITRFDIPNYRPCPDEFVLKLKELRYSEQTQKLYVSMFEEFINYYHKFDIDRIDERMIVAFIRYLVMERKVSTSYQNQSINAIKFYYERVLGGQRKIYTVDRPREEKTLPEVLSEQEVAALLMATTNLKHKCVLMIAYSAGLRLREIINLKIKDIDTSRMQLYIEQAKGKKDRYTILSPKLLELLGTYFIEYKPKIWLFEGPVPATQYSASSVQTIFKEAVRKVGITKKVSMHTLRHSFGTHLLENGTDLRYIQSLMGHASNKTTEIYTHITTKGFSQIKSPLDKLDIF